ncbi:MAG: sulfur carrier protein ThiS [Tissierellia bacterium]|nr:sulfur carrier protein ThiS [Tissierellia bacterium]
MMIINGRSISLAKPLSLSDLLKREGWLEDDRIAVELNGNIVRRSQWDSEICNDGDSIEVVRFVGGG